MRKKLIKGLLLSLTLLVMGCAADYEFGDISKSYCQSTNPEFRQVIKDNLAGAGIELGVDYCTAHGLVDAMIKMTKPIDYGGDKAMVISNKTVNVAKVQNQNFERQYNF